MVQRAAEAVNVATEKIRQLKLELFERSLKIEKLTQQLAAADAEVIQTRDKATKLEERFTQVGKGMYERRSTLWRTQVLRCLP